MLFSPWQFFKSLSSLGEPSTGDKVESKHQEEQNAVQGAQGIESGMEWEDVSYGKAHDPHETLLKYGGFSEETARKISFCCQFHLIVLRITTLPWNKPM